MDNISVDVDRFGLALDKMLGNIYETMSEQLKPVIRDCCKQARRECKDLAAKEFGQPYDEHYKDGFAFRVKYKNDVYVGEVGNKKKAGLTHLLEKGHARVGGGYVEGREHVSVAAKHAFDRFEEEAMAVVKGSLS